MIEEFRAKNYGCLRDVSVKLTPLHAFIGPNDSGKSMLLRAVMTLVTRASSLPLSVDLGIMKDGKLSAKTPAGIYSFLVSNEEDEDGFPRTEDGITTLDHSVVYDLRNKDVKVQSVLREIRGARLIRLEPEALRSPSGLIPESQSIQFMDEHGLGLPGVYLAILSRGDDTFRQIADDVRHHFPTVRNVRIPASSKDTVSIEVELYDGQRIPAKHMSEGLLYYFAFAVLPHIAPVSVLLVEEPENGLHPARIAEIVRVLRKISQTGTQVLLATHSPLVINELQPEEVTVVTRSLEAGTKLTPIKDTPNFSKRSSVYALGELWLSYANGVDEAPLLEGGPR
jgi:predicted ATPase